MGDSENGECGLPAARAGSWAGAGAEAGKAKGFDTGAGAEGKAAMVGALNGDGGAAGAWAAGACCGWKEGAALLNSGAPELSPGTWGPGAGMEKGGAASRSGGRLEAKSGAPCWGAGGVMGVVMTTWAEPLPGAGWPRLARFGRVGGAPPVMADWISAWGILT